MAASKTQKASTYNPSSKISLGDWLDIWMNQFLKIRIRQTTYDNYTLLIRVYIKPHLGHICLDELTPLDIQQFYNKLLNEGFSAKTVKNVHIVIHSALKQAAKCGYINQNVSEAVSLPKVERPEINTLSAEQVTIFLQAAKDDPLYPAFLLELYTGLRRGELLGLKWDDIDFNNCTIHVQRSLVRVYDQAHKTKLVLQPPKTKAGYRVIPIPNFVADTLKELYNKHQAIKQQQPDYNSLNLVFVTTQGTPIDPRNFERKFKQLLKKANLPNIRLHDLRHTVATLLLQQNVHPKIVQEILGHRDISTTLDIYSHVNLELKKQATNCLESLLNLGTIQEN
ncbi:tyrosine-type recombinase/integrase [Caldicellulosiruptor acetigenus]|uniref:tyrosine-type recombinase/integrase n=1 Tax=Caldicellulosiruptor acetigenus TaxID=301953 RepID=UPI0003F51F99|nr:site-specific integrase [Caldicellulosiruptor acetigenus]WAM35592.1 site-specific integrase [Caldicellulosiruptor acetigenus]